MLLKFISKFSIIIPIKTLAILGLRESSIGRVHALPARGSSGTAWSLESWRERNPPARITPENNYVWSPTKINPSRAVLLNWGPTQSSVGFPGIMMKII